MMLDFFFQFYLFAFTSAGKGVFNLKEVLEAENQADQVDGPGE